MNKFAPGDLVKYIPVQAHEDPRHPECEIGVVTSVGEFSPLTFVRFGGSTSQSCLNENLRLLAKTSAIFKVRGERESNTYQSGEAFVAGLGVTRGWRFEFTGTTRAPLKGEWYLSGAIPEAYFARADMSDQRHILRRIET